MARRLAPYIIPTTCRRCGKAIWTGTRSLVGTPAMKARYGRICAECFTPEEYEAMDQEFRQAVPGAIRAGAFR